MSRHIDVGSSGIPATLDVAIGRAIHLLDMAGQFEVTGLTFTFNGTPVVVGPLDTPQTLVRQWNETRTAQQASRQEHS